MAGWWVLLTVVCVLCLLFASPIRLNAEYQADWHIRAGYLFFSYQITPKKTKKNRKKTTQEKVSPKKEPAEKKNSALRDIIKEKGWKGFLSLLKQVADAAAGGLKKLFRHLKLTVFTLQIEAGGQDAAEAAMNYGYLCAAVYPAVGAIIANTKCKDHNIHVQANFQEQGIKVYFQTRASIPLIFVLAAACTALFRFLKAEVKKRTKMKEISE